MIKVDRVANVRGLGKGNLIGENPMFRPNQHEKTSIDFQALLI